MKKSTQDVLDVMHSFLEEYDKDNGASLAQMDNYFLSKISKNQLVDCLTDEELDSDDISCCKEMLKLYYNFELAVN